MCALLYLKVANFNFKAGYKIILTRPEKQYNHQFLNLCYTAFLASYGNAPDNTHFIPKLYSSPEHLSKLAAIKLAFPIYQPFNKDLRLLTHALEP